MPALYSGIEGVRIVSEVGLDAIREKSKRQTELIVHQADRYGFGVTAPRDPELRGGTVAVDVPHGYEVCQAMLAEDIVVDYRPKAGIRVAPHFFTRDEECLAALDRMAEIVENKEYERFLDAERRPG